MTCPLCGCQETRILSTRPHPGGSYRHCPGCDLIFATAAGILPPDEERERYLLHDNSHDNRGYVDMLSGFLERAVLPFATSGRALDFGCGPGPVLADLMGSRGFDVEVYDPFFHPDRGVLDRRYDVITATEVMEHVRWARDVWEDLVKMLTAGGILAVMTHFHPGADRFDDWWYHRDPTHIRFYSERTLARPCRELGLRLLASDGIKTATFQKPRAPGA